MKIDEMTTITTIKTTEKGVDKIAAEYRQDSDYVRTTNCYWFQEFVSEKLNDIVRIVVE